VAFRATFPIFDADGDLVTGATGLDSEISKDGGTFTDCTSEAIEIATASGMYYLDLTATEMNADTVAIIVKTTSSGAKTTPIVMYPEEEGDVRVDVNAVADAILKRDFTAVTSEASRSMLNALRLLRNKWDVASGTLTVKKEDDSTTAWTATITSNPSAEPIIGSDPA
jgi:hypothetical protein